jgi:4-hydroxy-tetrahydrodipicolinate synthase
MGTFPQVIKEGLELEGIEVGKCLDPIAPLSNDQREELRSIMQTMGLL